MTHSNLVPIEGTHSGNFATLPTSRGGRVCYDRGALLWRIAQEILRGACPEHLANVHDLTTSEVAAVLSMSD